MADGAFSAEFLADYEVLGAIGRGGMAEVFRARQRSLEREVAIKVLSGSTFGGGEMRARFEREAQVTARLDHPNVVGLYGVGEDRGRPFIVLELVHGESLRDLMTRSARMGPARAVEVAAQVGAGLAAAHALGIVHRDLKPENVLLDLDGTAKVADFGLARYSEGGPASGLTKAGIIVGTPGYLAPEVIRGDAAGAPADLFALGVLLFEMITGEMPVNSKNAGEILVAYVKEELPRASDRVTVPPALDMLIARLMARDPAQRPVGAAAVVEELAQLRAALPEASEEPTRSKSSATRVMTRRTATTRAVSVSAIPKAGLSRPLSARGLARPQTGVVDGAVAVAAATGGARAMRAGAVVAVLALVCAGAWLGLSGSSVTVKSGPEVFAGAKHAVVRWTTDRPALTRFLVWPEDGVEESAVVAGASQALTTEHSVVINQVRAEGRYRGRVKLPGGSPKTAAVPFETLSESVPPVDGVQPRFEPDGRLSVGFESQTRMTPGLRLGGGSTVWADRPGPGRFELTLPFAGDGALSLRFRELDADKSSMEEWPLTHLPQPDQVVSQFLSRTEPWPDRALARARDNILHAPAGHKEGGWPATRKPGLELLAALNPEQKAQLKRQAVGFIAAFVKDAFHVDVQVLLSAVPVAMRSPGLAARRQEIYDALARLDELDGACELVSGEPAVGFAAAASSYLRTEVLPVQGTTIGIPVTPPDAPQSAAYIARSGLPIFNHLNFNLFSSLAADLAIWAPITEAARGLAIPDHGDPDLISGYTARVGRVPAGLDFGRPIVLTMEATNSAADVALWLRFGESKRVLLRASVAQEKPHMSFGSNPSRLEHASHALILRAHLPPAFLTEADRVITARVEHFSVVGGSTVPPPFLFWISQMGMANP